MVHHIMISLDKDKENTTAFHKWCTRHNLSHEVVPGVVVQNWKDYKKRLCPYAYYTMYNQRLTHHHFNSSGPIGCFLAHINAWTICVQKQENVWVFEEGVCSYNDAMFETLGTLQDIDLLLGHTVPVVDIRIQKRIKPYDNNKNTCRNGLLHIDKVYYGTKCYCISPRFAKCLIKQSKQFGTHVDTYMCTMAIYHSATFRTFRTPHNIVKARSSGTINHTIVYSMFVLYFVVLFVVILFGIQVFVYKKFVGCKQQLRTCTPIYTKN